MRVQPTEAARRRLLAAIEGDPQAAPILATVWGAVALQARRRPRMGRPSRRRAFAAADLADWPRLAAEVIAAAVGGGLIDTDRHHQRRRIRWRRPRPRPAADHRKETFVTDYVTPPPQLSRDDLAHLTPAEISRALESGQLRALLNRRPTRPDRRPGRRTPDPPGLAAMTPAQIAAADQKPDNSPTCSPLRRSDDHRPPTPMPNVARNT